MQSSQAKLQLSHKEAKIEIQTEQPRVVIDQYACFASSGLMGPIDLSRDAAQRAIAQVKAFTSKVAGDGDSMAAVENGDPMPGIVERDAYPEHEFGMDVMPSERPKITVTGSVQTNVQSNALGINNGVEGTITPGNIRINYTPSQVKISMQQYASITIDYQRTGFNTYV